DPGQRDRLWQARASTGERGHLRGKEVIYGERGHLWGNEIIYGETRSSMGKRPRVLLEYWIARLRGPHPARRDGVPLAGDDTGFHQRVRRPAAPRIGMPNSWAAET